MVPAKGFGFIQPDDGSRMPSSTSPPWNVPGFGLPKARAIRAESGKNGSVGESSIVALAPRRQDRLGGPLAGLFLCRHDASLCRAPRCVLSSRGN
jgi:hypothetical protein